MRLTPKLHRRWGQSMVSMLHSRRNRTSRVGQRPPQQRPPQQRSLQQQLPQQRQGAVAPMWPVARRWTAAVVMQHFRRNRTNLTPPQQRPPREQLP